MKSFLRRPRIIAVSVAILLLLAATAVWVGAVEHWIGRELRALAAAHLNATFAFDDLTYTFPRTITLRGVRLTSSDPEAPSEPIEILAVDSLTVALSEIPQPDNPFRMQKLDLAGPTLRLVRIGVGEESGNLLGFSHLLKEESEPAALPAQPPARLSELFQVRVVSIEGGRALFDSRDGSAAIMLIDGIIAKLLLQPDDAGAYGLDFTLDHHPALTLALRGRHHIDKPRLEVDTFSSTLQLARDQDHYLTPPMQKLLAERDITGRMTAEATGMVALDDAAASHLQAHVELSDAGFTAGDYGLALDRVGFRIAAAGNYRLALDHVGSRFSAVGNTVTIEEFAIDALGGHAKIDGTFELDDSLSGALRFEGRDLQIGDLLRGADDPDGVPSFSGLLGFSGTLRGPLADIDQRAQGQGRLSLQKARLARLPVLSTIDDAIDPLAEAAMKREHTGHDALSLDFSLEGDRVRIAKLRMNSRWYGLRGHGDVGFDSQLDLAVDGGPVQRAENELGAAGDVLGEITETLLRARVTGTLGEPKVGIEVLRQRLR
jgi:hypothetical protein